MTSSNTPLVGILMGSDSDWDHMQPAAKILEEFGIPYEVEVCSAHRSPQRTAEYSETAASRGIKVIIAGAGAAAHLAGVIAAHTTLPVLGVPIPSSPLSGLDALLSTAQMPGGIPVATMALGKPGSKNAALFAVAILALGDDRLRDELKSYRAEMVSALEARSEALNRKLRRSGD